MFFLLKMINFAWIIRYPGQKCKHYSYLFEMDKNVAKYLSKVKHKQIFNLFTQKTYKKGNCQFIFTVWVLGEKIVLLFRKLPMKIAENPTVRIKRRLLQVIHIILLFIFNCLIFCFGVYFCFLGEFLGVKLAREGPQVYHCGPTDPNFFSIGKKSGVRTFHVDTVRTHAPGRVRSPAQGFLT